MNIDAKFIEVVKAVVFLVFGLFCFYAARSGFKKGNVAEFKSGGANPIPDQYKRESSPMAFIINIWFWLIASVVFVGGSLWMFMSIWRG